MERLADIIKLLPPASTVAAKIAHQILTALINSSAEGISSGEIGSFELNPITHDVEPRLGRSQSREEHAQEMVPAIPAKSLAAPKVEFGT